MNNKGVIFLKVVLLMMALMVAFVLGMLTLQLFSGSLNPEVWSFAIPILTGFFVTSIPYFIALFQGNKILTYMQSGRAFSRNTLAALKIIRNMAFLVSGVYALLMPFFYRFAQADDAPGVIVMGAFPLFGALIIAIFSWVLYQVLEEGVVLAEEAALIV